MVGAVMDKHWFTEAKLDIVRNHVLMVAMPVFFLSTGLRTNWAVGGASVFVAASALLVASVSEELAVTDLAEQAHHHQ